MTADLCKKLMNKANAQIYFEQVGVEVVLDSEGWDLFYSFAGFSIFAGISNQLGKGSGGFEEDCEMGNLEHIKQQRCQMCCLSFIRKWIMKYF